MVVVYIYFTRIVVYLLTASVSYHLLWYGPLATESATLLFFVVTGYKFKPSIDNPYLPVKSEDLEGHEYGLDEDNDPLNNDVELVMPAARSSSGKKAAKN